jgi:hypothetical protein
MKRISLAILLAFTAACASSGATTGSGASSPADKRNTITAEDIAKARSPGWYAYELINSVRPNILNQHNAVTL